MISLLRPPPSAQAGSVYHPSRQATESFRSASAWPEPSANRPREIYARNVHAPTLRESSGANIASITLREISVPSSAVELYPIGGPLLASGRSEHRRRSIARVKAKNGASMCNGVLAKFVCHNLCCLIQSMEEFGIDPNFGARQLSESLPL